MAESSPFDPVGHESVAEAVIEQIEQMIVDGILKEGRKLPSERDLADAMGVSRPKLREALQTLEQRGLIHVRHGEGSFIAQLTGRAMSPALLDLYARHGSAFYDYMEYRREQEAFADGTFSPERMPDFVWLHDLYKKGFAKPAATDEAVARLIPFVLGITPEQSGVWLNLEGEVVPW